jgi:hypothetical protein
VVALFGTEYLGGLLVTLENAEDAAELMGPVLQVTLEKLDEAAAQVTAVRTCGVHTACTQFPFKSLPVVPAEFTTSFPV